MNNNVNFGVFLHQSIIWLHKTWIMPHAWHGTHLLYFCGVFASFLKLKCYSPQQNMDCSLQIVVVLCVKQKKVSHTYRFKMTFKSENDDRISIFEWTIPLKICTTSSHIATHTSALAEIFCRLQIKLLPWWNYKQIKWLAKAAIRNILRQNPNAVFVQKRWG